MLLFAQAATRVTYTPLGPILLIGCGGAFFLLVIVAVVIVLVASSSRRREDR